MITRTPATVGDILQVCRVAKEDKTRGMLDFARKWAKINISMGPAWTIRYDQTILLVGGISILGDMGQAWAVVSPALNTHLKDGYKIIKQTYLEEIKIHKLMKVVAIAVSPEAQTFVEHLGLENSGEIFDGEKVYTMVPIWD